MVNRDVVGSETVIKSNVQVGEEQPFSDITLIGGSLVLEKGIEEKAKEEVRKC